MTLALPMAQFKKQQQTCGLKNKMELNFGH